MIKEYLNNFCECNNAYLLYMGSFSQRGSHWQDESYMVDCYYCSECGKELQIYNGYHNDETKKLYNESLKYKMINSASPFVIDVTRINKDISYCNLEDKRYLINKIIEAKGITSVTSHQIVIAYKKK